MTPTFKDYITESEGRSVEDVFKQLVANFEIIDKDSSNNTFIIRDTTLGNITNNQHTFEVHIASPDEIIVVAHNDHDNSRAEMIKAKLTENLDTRSTTLRSVEDRIRR